MNKLFIIFLALLLVSNFSFAQTVTVKLGGFVTACEINDSDGKVAKYSIFDMRDVV